MHISLVSLFPEFFQSPLSQGLMSKGQDKGLVSFDLVNPRHFAQDRHHTVDDRPYGGGPGMVMMPGPLSDALRGLPNPGRMLLMTPGGKPFDQSLAFELAEESALTIICGRYEGIDARVEELFPLEPVSVGDFVLSGGEAAALCVVEAVTRLIPGFMGHEQAWEEESFTRGLLEYPHYTRPEIFEGLEVPEILRSGDHGKISDWRRERALLRTMERRPELLERVRLGRKDMRLISQWRSKHEATSGFVDVSQRLYLILVHYPVLNKFGDVQASSLTNLDVHDMARCSCTYGLGGFYVTTPLEDQRLLAQELLDHWVNGRGRDANPHRSEALERVRVMEDVQSALDDIARHAGQPAKVLLTSAKGPETVAPAEVKDLLRQGPVALVLGTASGLAPTLKDLAHGVVRPLRCLSEYNHLSVRSAASILVDRLLGDWD